MFVIRGTNISNNDNNVNDNDDKNKYGNNN